VLCCVEGGLVRAPCFSQATDADMVLPRRAERKMATAAARSWRSEYWRSRQPFFADGLGAAGASSAYGEGEGAGGGGSGGDGPGRAVGCGGVASNEPEAPGGK